MSATRQSRAVEFGTASLAAGFLGLAAVLVLSAPSSSRAQTAAGDVAAQIRAQGYPCDEPVAAHRSTKRSKRDSAVWMLSCSNGAYRVRLDPNMAAHVTRLKSRKK